MEPFTPLTAPSGEPQAAGQSNGCTASQPLPEGWRSITTGLRGTRLYHVTLPAGGGVYWEAAVILNDELVHRRFAGELHARAWLTLATELSPSAAPFDLEQMHGRFRAAGVAAGNTAPVREVG